VGNRAVDLPRHFQNHVELLGTTSFNDFVLTSRNYLLVVALPMFNHFANYMKQNVMLLNLSICLKNESYAIDQSMRLHDFHVQELTVR